MISAQRVFLIFFCLPLHVVRNCLSKIDDIDNR